MVVLLFVLLNCKSEAKQNENNPIHKTNVAIEKINDSLINHITTSLIGEKIIDIKKINELKNMFKVSLERDFERPYMWDVFVSSNDTLLEFYTYKKDIELNKVKFNTYFIIINYEDSKYESLMLINENSKNIFNCLIIYESLQSEETYQRISEIKSENNLTIKYSIDNKYYRSQLFTIKKGLFLDYMESNEHNLEWEDKEIKGLNYLQKGKALNNLKNGYWEEKRYSIEYGKIIIMDGNYVQGIKDGEWNYSPDGPVDKVEVFSNGIYLKTYYP